jgi:ABC-type Fe3+ transport system permease subunit
MLFSLIFKNHFAMLQQSFSSSAFTSFAVIAILGDISHRTIESEIFTQAIRLGDTRTATSLAIVQAVVVLLVLRWGNPASREPTHGTQTIQFFDTSRTPVGLFLFFSVALPALIVVTSPSCRCRSIVFDEWTLLASWISMAVRWLH